MHAYSNMYIDTNVHMYNTDAYNRIVILEFI